MTSSVLQRIEGKCEAAKIAVVRQQEFILHEVICTVCGRKFTPGLKWKNDRCVACENKDNTTNPYVGDKTDKPYNETERRQARVPPRHIEGT